MSDPTPTPPAAWLDRDSASQAIQQMSYDDLLFLNARIIDRLKLMDQARSTVEMAQFNVGDRVVFPDHSGQPRRGVVLKLNKKTASIHTDDGQRWNVPPGAVETGQSRQATRGLGII